MAADTRHTPGPWIGAGPSFGGPLPRYTTEITTEYEGAEGEVISICELPFAHHDDENEANARLIAAAPDLLEALKTIVENGGIGPEDMFHDARDAIRKAIHG